MAKGLLSKALRLVRRKASVLIVDDDDDIRQLAKTMLQDDFGDIWEANSGEAAIDIAYKERPDIVLLDYMMPKMDGEAVANGLQKLIPQARIVSFSAVLDTKPWWADAHLSKSEISNLVSVLQAEAEAIPR